MNTLLENIRASAILMKNLPSTLSGDALLISREEARRIGYELEACAERIEQKAPEGMAIVPVEPTRAMCKAATSYTHSHDAKLIYKAMLAATKDALECTGCGWRGTKTEYRAQMKAGGFLACCPESSLLAATKEKGE